MADYTNTYTKTTGDTIGSSEFSTEFSSIETAVNSKADVDGDTLTNMTIGSGYSGGAVIADTAQATTSGSSVTFTAIPSWAKRIHVLLDGVSLNAATDGIYLRIGDSGGIETTGYESTALVFDTTGSVNATTVYFYITHINQDAAGTVSGSGTLSNVNGNTWVWSGNFGEEVLAGSQMVCATGTKTLTDTLTQLQVATSLTFDAGQVNIQYEG